jgi:hypothetical protein
MNEQMTVFTNCFDIYLFFGLKRYRHEPLESSFLFVCNEVYLRNDAQQKTKIHNICVLFIRKEAFFFFCIDTI